MEKLVWDVCTGVAKPFIQCLVGNATEELGYLHNYKSYVEDFKKEQGRLLATVASVKLKIDKAKKRNETLVDPRVKDWLERAEQLVQLDPEPTKCFGFCMNCFSQIGRAKELRGLTNEQIPKLLAEVDKFDAYAHAAGVPGMEFHSQEFMSFESRKANFEELKKELQDENNYVIGLQGMGGTGKSTMAIEVGKHVEKSNPFDRVIFITVSTPVEEKKIRDQIARELEFQLEEEKLLTHAQQIWNKIAYAGKVLIILDDVWEKLNLKNIGIQPGFHSKGYCNVLLTTSYENVCTQMRCQKKIKLDILPEKDALKLFLFHAMENGQDCPDDMKKVALDIVNECGRLLVIVVAVAKTINDWPETDWQYALIALRNADEPSRGEIVDDDAMKFYNSLKLSYTHLNDEKAQLLFLLCSIFPKAHTIPVELLSRIAIGFGLFGEVDKYHTTRSQVHVKKNKLINSSLLLNAGEECVKMHDVIRNVALEIANKEMQVIMDSRTNLKENVKYSSWIVNDFPNCFDGGKLIKVLLVWICGNRSLNVPNTLFRAIESLRVLLLYSKIEFGRTSAPSLPKSIQTLKDIQTLSLTNWELGDISELMRNLQKLESLELSNCSIVELPNEISELNKLRFLCLIRCSLENNNPFEVISRCSQLEELYYISNDDHIPIGAKVPQIISLPSYQMYHIDGSKFSAFDYSQLDASIKKSFKPAKLQRIFSKEVIKSLAAGAEILELKGDNEMGLNNLIPSMVSIEDGAMKDLQKLSLKHWSEMKCLIYTGHLQHKAGVTAVFSKLAELQLVKVNVREICYGRYPDGFLKQLERLELNKCRKLESALFKGKLELGNLKSIDIEDCSMTSLFHPSTAQSLTHLETLKLVKCSKLEYIIRDEEKVAGEDLDPRCHDSMFPELKLLNIEQCKKLKFILPIRFCEDLLRLESVEISKCKSLRYVFAQYPRVGGFHQMQKEITLPSLKVMTICEVPLFVNIYPECYLPQKSSTDAKISSDPVSFFLPKLRTINKDEPSTSETTQSDHTTSSQGKYVGKRALGIFTPPLYPCNLRKMNIVDILNLSKLFSVSIASSMSLLEELVVSDCDELEHIVTEEEDGHHHMNANSIFPNLRTIEINQCENLEYAFPASCSMNLLHLESIKIVVAYRLKYVFGKSCGDDNSPHQKHNTEINLSALNKLWLEEVRNMIRMCPENYYVKALSLQDILLSGTPQLPIDYFIDLSIEGQKRQEQLSRKRLIGIQLCNLKHLHLDVLEVETIYDLERLQIASPVYSCLETLILTEMDNLRNICVGPKKFHLSFQNLCKIMISECSKLKFILSTSISRSLPYLRHLWVSNCEDLERIIGDDDDDDDEECYFPNLHIILVERCKRLKCLFSMSTRASFPQLTGLRIEDAPELEQVFEEKQDATTQELDIKHVFPKLFLICLRNLPKLHTICSSIDFHTVMIRVVANCTNISLTSADNEFLASYGHWLEEAEGDTGNVGLDFMEQLLDRLTQLAEKTIMRDPPTPERTKGSTNIKEIAEASDEENPESEVDDEAKDSEQINKSVPFAASSQIESPRETVKPTSEKGATGKEATISESLKD